MPSWLMAIGAFIIGATGFLACPLGIVLYFGWMTLRSALVLSVIFGVVFAYFMVRVENSEDDQA